MSDDEPPTRVSGLPVTEGPAKQFWLGIDPVGDIFGDYTARDFGGDNGDNSEQEPFEDNDPESIIEAQEEDKIAEYDAFLAEEVLLLCSAVA